jgi:hypothetical protein
MTTNQNAFWDFIPSREHLESIDHDLQNSEWQSSVLNAHGVYETLKFVLRLSPRNHELVDSLSTGVYGGGQVSQEALQAYSTYIHETVHWWQHMGSTSGLVYSLCFMAQSHGAMDHLRKVVSQFGPKKSLKAWTDQVLLNEGPKAQERLASANISVNNALDLEYYRLYATRPYTAARWLVQQKHFESIGHSYHMAYGLVIGLVASSIDPKFEALPNPQHWEAGFRELNAQRVTGYYCGSPIHVPKLGLHAIFEGQARFVQLQFLDGCFANAPTMQDWRELGYLKGIYIEAFERFLELSESEFPESISDPIVNLFLLICDIAINPCRAITSQIEDFARFIDDVDVGIRFQMLCDAIRVKPELRTAIRECSRNEYVKYSGQLAKACGFEDPIVELEKISGWVRSLECAVRLMQEHASFDFNLHNLPVRVIISHFLSFSVDKLSNPEFFCWPGRWMAGRDTDDSKMKIWLRHLSLFTDRSDKPGIYPRVQPGRGPSHVQATFEQFYGGVVLYDITRQWVLRDGDFDLNFEWLVNSEYREDEAVAWVDRILMNTFGIRIADFEILGTPSSLG